MSRENGFTLLELLFTCALIATALAMAIPTVSDAIDSHRTASAARYLAGRIYLARMEAVKRSTNVGIRFEASGSDYAFAAYADGNANGVRTLDIRTGIDRMLIDRQRLADNFPQVRIGLMSGVPEVDGGAAPANGDGVRIGSARILTLGSNGTATAGTVYLHGRRRQFAVRVFGVTGRTRVMEFNPTLRTWNSR
jgi:prepilin-type N-terminal cleavage/methylation domain-containing protein